MPHTDYHYWEVNIGSGNGFVSSDNKQLSEKIDVAMRSLWMDN